MVSSDPSPIWLTPDIRFLSLAHTREPREERYGQLLVKPRFLPRGPGLGVTTAWVSHEGQGRTDGRPDPAVAADLTWRAQAPG